MIFILKNDKIEVLITKMESKYKVEIKTNVNTVKREFNSRLELISSLEKNFSEQVFYQIP